MAYRTSRLDRMGVESPEYSSAFVGALIAGALTAFAGFFYAPARSWNPFLAAFLGFTGGGVAGWLAIMGAMRLATGSLNRFTSGAGTYEQTFSYEESLLARGNYAEAISAYERHAAEGTGGATVMVRAADLHIQHGNNPKRASELYRAAQTVPGVSAGDHLYATNRLIDLYTGPLANPDAAVSELRRVIAMYPSSPAAKHARTALVNLKRQLRSESSD